MRKFILVALLILSFSFINAQSDSTNTELVKIPNSKYAVYKYDSTLKANILTYRYSDLWDLDNDGQKDSIIFISNGGAHAFFHLEIWLSSSNSTTKFQNLYTDFPYPKRIKSLNEIETYFPHVVIHDFDSDGIDELFLNLNHNFAPTQAELKEMGISSKQIIIDYKSSQLNIIDFKK